MCTMCALTSQSEDNCAFEASTFATYQTVIETSDSDWSTGNVYYLSPGDSFVGSISFVGDLDTVRIWLEADMSYRFDLTGLDGGGGSLADPYLVLWGPTGSYVAENDDAAGTWDSSLSVIVKTSGYYDLDLSSSPYFDPNGTGSYTLAVSAGTPFVMPDAGTLDELADYLMTGYWLDNGISPRKFNTSVSNEITVDLTGLTVEGEQLARWALSIWATYADLVFVEVSSGAQITFDDTEDGAYSSSVTSGATILSAEVNISVDWITAYGATFDSYSLQTYIHEIGHALGLGHQGAYNGWAEFPYDATFANDSWQISVMSYFSQVDNTLVDASEAYVVAPMMADILAISQMYGLSDATLGDTTWGTGSSLGGAMAMIFAALQDEAASPYYAGYPVALTIADTGGIDTIDLSGYLGNHYLSLVAETFSDIGGLMGNLGIARGTDIENAIGGEGNDTIIGNALDNAIWGGASHDYLDGSSGNDVLYGSAGTDTLDGGVGDDTLYGGNQADSLRGGHGLNLLYGGNGNDTLSGGRDADTLYGEGGADAIWAGGGRDFASGGDGDDRIGGMTGADTLYGDAGNDTLWGGELNDELHGGDDNDLLAGGEGGDLLYGDAGNDTLEGSSGIDILWGGTGDDLLQGGTYGDQLHGEEGADTLQGEDGYDRLWGDAGADLLDGGAHNDKLYGGADNDTLLGGDGKDTLDGEEGNDLLDGGEHDDGLWGGSGDDTILGGGGDDRLGGQDGADLLYGGLGDDTLWGGLDADVFEFSAGTDELRDFAAGEDLILFAADAVGITDLADLLSHHATQIGTDLHITDDLGNVMILVNTALTDLNDANTDFI